MFLSRYSWNDNAMNVTLLFGGVFVIIVGVIIMRRSK